MIGLENPLHILFLLAVILMVFGARRLPEMGRGLGEGMRGFRDALSGNARSAEVTAGGTAAGDSPVGDA